MRRVMSLWLPGWPIERQRRAGGSLSAPSAKPAVVVDWVGGRGVLTAVDPALAASLAPGMALADARAIEPGITVLAADPAGDQAALQRLALWCGRYSPWTAPAGGDGVWIDLTGAAHLHGGEGDIAHELVARLERQGIKARAAIADTPGAAWAMARAGARPVTVVPPGAARVALALLPVRVLRLPSETVELMERLGLRRIGDLYKLPRPSLVARFGLTAAERLDQALGNLPEPLSPLPPEPVRAAHRRFAEPIARPEDLAAAIASLAQALCRFLAADGMGARRLRLAFYRVDGAVIALEAGTAQPSRDPRHLARLFVERLDRVEPDLGIEDMRLEALGTERLAEKQAALAGALPAGSAVGDAALAALVDRLENRLGAGSVTLHRPQDSHLPERAANPAPVFATVKSGAPWPLDRPRPIRLLARPEPVEAVAPVPDDPPLLFRWRRHLHRVRLADGPERILGEWWREKEEKRYAGEKGWRGGFSPADEQEGALRDYYHVEDMEGRRFWLYRAGLHRPEAAAPRWYLHGVFA